MNARAAVKSEYEFQAEVPQLLSLMVHSLYSNKEIFLRELISNASDACDQLRFEALRSDALLEGDPDLEIHVNFDKEARTITVSDNGIGMARDEVIADIGTIAKSGTKEFLASLTGDQAKHAQMIGQFGVGFYSSFIVADKVTVVTRKAGEKTAVYWESAGTGTYILEPGEREQRGTDVIERFRRALEDDVEDVRVTVRLTQSPACIVLKEFDMALHMQRLMRQAGHEVPKQKPILEINHIHPLVKKIEAEPDEDRFKEWAELLLNEAILAEGGQLEDPAAFVKQLNQFLI